MKATKNKQTLVTFEDSNEQGCLIWTIPFFALFIWSILNAKMLWTIISILIIFAIAKQEYNSIIYKKQFNKWIEENDKTVIFFYPTNQLTQNNIKDLIGIKLKRDIKQMFYDKSKIVGDLKNQQFIKMGLCQLNWQSPNHPRLIQINGKSLVEIIDLYDLNRIEKLEPNRMEEIVKQINTYA